MITEDATFLTALYLTYYQTTILDSSRLKEFADDNFDENGRKLSKRVENTVGKEKFLFFPQYFQKACFPGASKGVIVWERVKKRFSHLARF